MTKEDLIHQPSQRDLDTISTVNQKVAQRAGTSEQSPLIGGEKFDRQPYKITSSFANEVSQQLLREGYTSRKLVDTQALEFISQLPNGSMIQLGLPNIPSGRDLTPVYGLKVPYASQSGELAEGRVGLLLSADIRGFSKERKATRFPSRIEQVYATGVLPAFDPRYAEDLEYAERVMRNVQLALGAGLNKVRAKFGMQEIESTVNNRHSPVDATHDSATFQLLSFAARQQVSNDPEKLVHLNHFTGSEGTNIFNLLQQEFAYSSPLIDEMNRLDSFTYPFPLRLIELPLSGLPHGLPTELQFTGHTIMPEQDGLYPLDLSPVAAIQDVRARGLNALGDSNLIRDPMSGLNRATGGQDFLSLL